MFIYYTPTPIYFSRFICLYFFVLIVYRVRVCVKESERRWPAVIMKMNERVRDDAPHWSHPID